MAATPAAAQSVETESVRVSYADINLESDAGAERFLRRLERAANQVCGAGIGRRMTLQEHREIRKCRSGALEQAVADLGHYNVTSRFASLGGGVAPVMYASR
jgi:UrcA family protein